MLQNFLFIGTGGSGGATLRYLYRDIDSRLRAAGWHEGVPDCFQFLHIDLPHQAGGVDAPDVPASVARKLEYVGLGHSPREFPVYDKILMEKAPGAQRLYTEFRPDPCLEWPKPFHGAGQIRVIGRIVALSSLSEIQASVRTVADRMSTVEAIEQLHRLSDKVESGDLPHNEPARCVLFSSLSGGSGSGIFLDVLEALRANANAYPWLSSTSVTLYSPDLFNNGEGIGTTPNSFAALSELVASVDHIGPDTPSEASLATHGPTPVINRRGPSYTFLVGNAGDKGGTFTRPSQVFQATASAFGAIVLDGKPGGLLDGFENFVIANWQAAAPKTPLVLRRANNQGLAKGLGRSSASLGRRLFAQYAAERLAQHSLEVLTNGHRLASRTADRSRPEEELIAEIAKQELDDRFRAACGFADTRGSNTSVTEALLPRVAREAKAKELGDGLIAALRETELVKRKADEWKQAFLDRLQVAGLSLIGTDSELLAGAGQKWVKTTQDTIIRETANLIGRIGLAATAKTLQGLEAEVRSAAAHSLKRADELQNRDEPTALAGIHAVFDKLQSKVITPESEKFDDASTHAKTTLDRRTLNATHRVAAQLMSSLAEDFLPQLARTVELALVVLNADLKDEQIKASVRQWPAHDVSPHLRPAPTDVLISPWSEWPATFDGLLAEQFEAMVEQAMGQVTSEILGGAYPREGTSGSVTQDLIRQRSEWWPEPQNLRPQGKTPAQASFQLPLRVFDVLDRATTWVNGRSPAAVQLYVKEQLSDYLDPDHPEALTRGQNVIAALKAALPLGRPLVALSDTAVTAFYGNEANTTIDVQVSKIPATAAMQDAVVGALRSAGAIGPNDDGLGLLDPNAKGDTIEIVSFHHGSFEPWAFKSVIDPIVQAFPFGQPHAGDFWSNRRARHLGGFIPLSTAHQAAMVRGIVTAAILGDVSLASGDLSRQKIWSPAGFKRFPYPLLSQPAKYYDVAGALLEALPIALVRAGAGSMEEWEAYERLIELGLSDPWRNNLANLNTVSIGGYHALNAELSQWIMTGTRPPSQEGITDETPTSKLSGATEEERRESVVNSLHSAVEQYTEWAAEPVGATTFALPFHNQSASLMAAAAQQILARLKETVEDNGVLA